MGLGDITPEAVRRAIDEYDRLGAEAFRSTYGFGRARRQVLVHDGRTYDSTAIVGVAHGFATGMFLRSNDFTGGATSAVQTLQRLGFDARDMVGLPQPDPQARYGEIPGSPEGSTFASRAEVRRAGVHRPIQAGICGTKAFGAESIVISGGYVDDEDLGDLIIYTGHGGQDRRKQQIADQTFKDSGNAALQTSSQTGEPVRVVRGAHKESRYAPASGFRYDGRAWPGMPAGCGRTHQRSTSDIRSQSFLSRLVDRLPRVPELPHADDYLAVLDQALLDRHLSASEQDALLDLAESLDRGEAAPAVSHRARSGCLGRRRCHRY